MPNNKKKQKKKGLKVGSKALKSEPNIEMLLKEAESAIDTFSYEEATQKLNDVLRISANNIKALDMLSSILLEQCKLGEAKILLKRCLMLSPNEGHSRYFSLAQLSESEESLTYYQKGIQILEKDLENFENVNPSEKSDRDASTRVLSDAYCSVAEIFMTDCCDAENAEEQCITAIENAIKSDPNNPEAHRCFAALHLVKDQLPEAKQCIEKSLSLWFTQLQAQKNVEEQSASADIEHLLPSYISRMETSKILIELQMYDEATNILDDLLEEDDEVPDVWYLQGMMNYVQGDEYKLNAHYYLNKALEVCKKLGQSDAEFLPEVQELLAELQVSFPLEDVEESCELDVNSDSENDNEMET